MLAIGIANFRAGFEVGGVGSAGLQNGQAMILLGSGADGVSGYAIKGKATAVIDTPIMDTTGQVTINGNTLGRAVERFFLPFTKRSRVPNRDGRGDFFFRRAPICRCRDAGKRKFAGETKTSVDRKSQNRAVDLTDRRSR